MGWFDVTLVLLKEGQIPKPFLLNLHKKFEGINLNLIIEDDEFIIFNDTQDGKENEIFYLNNLMYLEQVLNHLCNWKSLGLLSYRHSNFRFPITIDFRTWNDNLLHGFTIGFNGKEAVLNEKTKEQLILDIINLVDFKYVVGDIANTSNTYINLEQSLPDIIAYIEKCKFDLDIRK
jgi:hypothetical protein